MSAAEIPIRWARAPDELHDALAIRETVFCGEQGVPLEEEQDGLDEDAHHLLALQGSGGRPVGTLRLLVYGEQAKIGRVAVERDWRGQGIASRMLTVALERARELGCAKARLAAQVEAKILYERAGFTVESEPFEQAGILHVWMGRRLNSQP